ncbi:MAG: redox-sensing transcriptional repressor Rex [Alicyclobacillaceae bacterium]|nr:redox-sensing transcriptional repressor Rex [Alicyclobacillaceae bacterium]
MSTKAPRIPLGVIRRLPVYLRHLKQLEDHHVQTVSSQELGAQLDLNPAQIRKDLAYFGEFGRKGIGYEVRYLIDKIEQILKLDREIPVALVGAGHLGIALCHYNQNKPGNLVIGHVFDNDPAKVGMRIGQVVVRPAEQLERCLREHQIRMAVIAVPAEHAQEVADRLVQGGVTAILNFAPAALRVPEHVHLRNADFTSELQSLAYYVLD